MRIVVSIGVLSVVGVLLMIRSAISVGFGVLVGPILICELVLLGGLYALWRGLGGGEDESDRVRVARPVPVGRTSPAGKPGRAVYPPARIGGPRPTG